MAATHAHAPDTLEYPASGTLVLAFQSIVTQSVNTLLEGEKISSPNWLVFSSADAPRVKLMVAQAVQEKVVANPHAVETLLFLLPVPISAKVIGRAAGIAVDPFQR